MLLLKLDRAYYATSSESAEPFQGAESAQQYISIYGNIAQGCKELRQSSWINARVLDLEPSEGILPLLRMLLVLLLALLMPMPVPLLLYMMHGGGYCKHF